MARAKNWLLFSSTLLMGLVSAAGCGSGGAGPEGDALIDNGFESDDPSGRSASGGGAFGASSADAGAAPSSASNGASGDDASKEAARTVEEADVLKVDGNRLYALSRYGGLSVVDITDPDHMKVLGRKRTDGMPFEMYVRNGRAYVMLNDFGRYVREANSMYGSWVQTSEIVALDVSDPAHIGEVTSYDVPGSIADSRVVGDALYLVTYENGYCWRCSDTPATTVTSFDVSGTTIAKVDQLQFTSPNKSYSWWQRSVSATNERLYIAGPEWSWSPGQTNASSVIQVVDIRDPKGHLVKGADVPVAGQINSRWQIDEYQGVLRVVSQFGNGWWGPNNNNNPQVQTFTVTSAQSITPLGKTQLSLPTPESLRSVRFDGTRAYAITAQQTDPLFTIDLSNPAAPKQAGQLQMPGWIFYMEPRGDRLIGFGYEGTTWNSRLAVSLFDVSDLANPTMLKRVAFGAGHGSLAEDQDRIHKSVQVLDEQGLILVPFASYGSWNGNACVPGESGIQIIDYSKDDLVARGVAPQWGMPRRAFLANERLLAISDRNVTSFDIAAKDAPVKKGELDLSNPAYHMVETAQHIASITNDWWSGEVMLSLTPKDDADDASAVGKISLASLAQVDASLCSGSSNAWVAWYAARLSTNGSFVYVTVPVHTWASTPNGTSTSGGHVVVAAIDISNPQKPVLAGKAEMALTEQDSSKGWYGWYGDGFWDGYGYYSYWGGMYGSVVGSGTGLVQLGSKLAYLEVFYEPYETYVNGQKTWQTKTHRKLHVADMANPSAPVVSDPIDLGESLGAAPLHLASGKVLTSRWIPSNKNASKVRFFVDRVDISGASPVQLPSINTPGSLLAVDEATSRFVTTDYTADRAPAGDYQQCNKIFGYRGQFLYDSKECVRITRSFKLSDYTDTKVKLRQTFTPPSQNFGGIQLADDRIYVTRYRQYDYTNATYDAKTGLYEQKILEDGGLWAIGGIRAGQLSIVSAMDGDAEWPLAAYGSKVALYTPGGLAIYDTATPAPKLLVEANLRGYGYSSHVLMSDTRAVASLGEWGIQTVGF